MPKPIAVGFFVYLKELIPKVSTIIKITANIANIHNPIILASKYIPKTYSINKATIPVAISNDLPIFSSS
jgi:hypothetical protein